MTQDKRFSKVSTDPRFKQIKKDKTRVVLDSRFQHILEENGEYGNEAVVDKYGRKIEKSSVSELKRYYRLEERKPETGSNDDESKHITEPQIDGYNLARGEGLIDSSSEDEDVDEIALIKDQEDELELFTANAQDSVPLGDETCRFAVVNLDWDQVKASDLFKVFDGFAPKNGCVKSVKVYPSEFGKERMQQELMHGPPKSIFKTSSNLKLSKIPTANQEGEEFNHKELRKYQLERLKYYFAVVTCDSASTAKVIYTACDGAEFEATSNFFDMRFIPDDMNFEDEPTDEATETPAVYHAVDFTTKALQHSKVDLTWDNDDPQRAKVTRRKFTKDDISKMDFKAYLASSDSEGEDAVQYKKLLFGDEGDEVEGDMEVTFTPGLAEKAQDLLDKKMLEESIAKETPFETMLRKQREKRKNKKLQSSGDLLGDDEHTGSRTGESDSDDDNQAPRIEMSKEHLELLIDDDNTAHFDAREIIKSKKEMQSGFDLNVNDSRFKDVFSSHHFAIDPTHPSFKKTDNMQKLLKEKINLAQRSENSKVEAKVAEAPIHEKKSELNSLIDSVKRKSNSALFQKKGKRKLN